MRRFIPFLLGLVMCTAIMAQTAGKQTLQARMLTSGLSSSKAKVHGTDGNTVDVVIKLAESDAEATIEQLKAAGATLHSRLGQQVSVTMPLAAVSLCSTGGRSSVLPSTASTS